MVNRTRLERGKNIYKKKTENTSKETAFVPASVPVSLLFISVLPSHFLFAMFVGHLLSFRFIFVRNSPLSLFTLFFIIRGFVCAADCTVTANERQG
jgi:hypothetical protein